MTAPFRAWPYAALAVIQWLHTAPSLFLYVVFRHPMDQDVKPPLATWIVDVDGVPKTPASSAWLDEWTLELTVAAIPAAPALVSVEYDGPDENLRTTWQKQWEPWGAIVATSFQIIPPGVIVIWSGLVTQVPPGWALCDGTNGTPDFHNHFAFGGTTPGQEGQVGGWANHDHTFTSGLHGHTIPAFPPSQIESGAGFKSFTTSVTVSGTTDEEPVYPPFIKFGFIMKL